MTDEDIPYEMFTGAEEGWDELSLALGVAHASAEAIREAEEDIKTLTAADRVTIETNDEKRTCT